MTRLPAPAIFALIVLALGVAVVARTVALGVGGGLGLLIGGLMILGGGLRLYMVLAWRRR